MKPFLICIICFLANHIKAQSDTSASLNVIGYAEFYYNYNFSRPPKNELTEFVYNHKRHNELSINLAFIKLEYTSERLRANLANMVGTYAQYNLGSEPIWAQFILEANTGIKLSKQKNLWLDVGILPSHIGFESAIGADCWTLTRSILAENSPYYEAGARLTYISENKKWTTALLLLNGWQRISRKPGKQIPALGLQINYKPTSAWTLNYSNYIGESLLDDVDNGWRFFHNFYAIYTPESKFSFITGFDIGTDKYNLSSYDLWFSPVWIGRLTFSDRYQMAIRLEYYEDPKNIMITTHNAQSFKTLGLSANLDFQIFKNTFWRNEIKYFKASNPIFHYNNNQSTSNINFCTALTIRFSKFE